MILLLFLNKNIYSTLKSMLERSREMGLDKYQFINLLQLFIADAEKYPDLTGVFYTEKDPTKAFEATLLCLTSPRC